MNEKEDNVVPDEREVLEDVSYDNNTTSEVFRGPRNPKRKRKKPSKFGKRAGSNSERHNSDGLVSKPLKQNSLVQLKKIEASLIPKGNHPFLNLITFLY